MTPLSYPLRTAFFDNMDTLVKRVKLCNVYEQRLEKYAAKISELQEALKVKDV